MKDTVNIFMPLVRMLDRIALSACGGRARIYTAMPRLAINP